MAAARNKPRVDEDSEQILNLAAAESEDETEDSRRMNVQLVEDETSQLNKKVVTECREVLAGRHPALFRTRPISFPFCPCCVQKRESAAWFKYSTVASMEEQVAWGPAVAVDRFRQNSLLAAPSPPSPPRL